MNLLYKNFKGLIPRYDDHLLGDGFTPQLRRRKFVARHIRHREKKLCHAIKATTGSQCFMTTVVGKEFDKCVEFTRRYDLW